MSALEFALLAGPMIGLIVSMLETGLIAARISLLDSAMSRVAREIYIGNATQGTVDKDMLEDYICRRVGPFMSECDGNLNLEITPVTDLNSIPDNDVECRDADINNEPAARFQPGAGNNIIYLRACLTMDIIVPGMGIGLNLPKTSSGRYQTVSAIAFQNEPF